MKNKKGIGPWIWILIIVILIMAGIAVYFIFSGGDSSPAISAGSSGQIPQPPPLPE